MFLNRLWNHIKKHYIILIIAILLIIPNILPLIPIIVIILIDILYIIYIFIKNIFSGRFYEDFMTGYDSSSYSIPSSKDL